MKPHCLLLSLFLAALPAFAQDVKLQWDQNTETNLAGYKVYWGLASRQYYNVPPTVAVSPTPTYTVTGLEAGKTYFFAVTAFDTNGAESDFSNEVSKSIPVSGIKAPTGLKIVIQ